MTKYAFSLDPVKVPIVETKHRSIKTSIPAPGTKEILVRLEKTESRSMQGQLPIVWKKAEDFIVHDLADNRWIDFTSTIFVANIGHANKRILDALESTLSIPLISTYAYMNEQRAEYLEKLIAFAGFPFEKAFLL